MSVISAKDFKKLYDQPARDWALFDIREKGEAADGHIFGATNLPRRLIEFRITELVPDPSTQIFIYGDDERTSLALKTLPVGTAYAVWTGIGAVGTAALGIYLFGEPATAARLASIGLIVAGIVGLKLVT